LCGLKLKPPGTNASVTSGWIVVDRKTATNIRRFIVIKYNETRGTDKEGRTKKCDGRIDDWWLLVD
jgi:hypothetical protein